MMAGHYATTMRGQSHPAEAEALVRRCPECKGRGHWHIRIPGEDYEIVDCGACRGTGRKRDA